MENGISAAVFQELHVNGDSHHQVPRLATQDDMDSDIFRGQPVSKPIVKVESIAQFTSSSTSSSDTTAGGRLGAITAAIADINRWARGWTNASSASSSSSSSSSKSSIHTVIRRRRRRVASISDAQSELDVAARIRARHEPRQMPREFVLYNPIGIPPSESTDKYRTTSLPLIKRLLSDIQEQSRLRRPGRRSRLHVHHHHAHHHHTHKQLKPESGTSVDIEVTSKLKVLKLPKPRLKSSNRPASFSDLRALRPAAKGKEKETVTSMTPSDFFRVPPDPVSSSQIQPHRAWWLDVVSPTWEDMREIGKLLHLHPLTLEDILQQEPREKLEQFPRLGYYFTVFRAMESNSSGERFLQGHATDVADNEVRSQDAVIGGTTIYLVVFKDGICSFHFGDIDDHIENVYQRISGLDKHETVSPEWFAHSILDSVVDAFFPLLQHIEQRVMEAESPIFADKALENLQATTSISLKPDKDQSNAETAASSTEISAKETPALSSSIADEKLLPFESSSSNVHARFTLPRPTASIMFRRIYRLVSSSLTSLKKKRRKSPRESNQTAYMFRMAQTRKLVTAMGRLLATKSEVLAQIKKRLLVLGESGLMNGYQKESDLEMVIYMGDVHDHILTLQQSLNHYEQIMAKQHLSYLSQLQLSSSAYRQNSDRNIFLLTVLSIGVVSGQMVIGLFSMNVTVPSNPHELDGGYTWFEIVLGIVFATFIVYLYLVRRLWVRSKNRHRTEI